MRKILSLVAAAFLALTMSLGIGSTASASGLNIGTPGEYYMVAPDTIWTMVSYTSPEDIQGVSIPLTQSGPTEVEFVTQPGMEVVVGNNPTTIIKATSYVTAVSVSLKFGVPVPFEVLGSSKEGSAVVEYQGWLMGTPRGAEWSGTDIAGNNVYLYWNNTPGEVNNFIPGTIAEVPATDAFGNTKEGWVSVTQGNITSVSEVSAMDGWMAFQVPNTVGATLTAVSGNQTTTGKILQVPGSNVETFSPPPLIMR